MTAHWKCECPECLKRRAKRNERIALVVLLLLALALICVCSSCAGTVTPTAVHSEQASFDEGGQNSGLLSLVPGGAIITAHARDRYNALIETYGCDFAPALERDHGISAADRHFFITNEALEKFRLMNLWRKSGRLPSTK